MHPPAALHRNVQQENKASEREREREALESFPKRRVEDNLLGFRHVRIAQSIKSISTYARASRAQNHRALPKSIECYIYTLYRKYERERERGFEIKSSHVSNGSLAIYRSIAYWPRPRCIIASCACLDQVFQLSLVVQQQRLLIWAGTLRLSREKLNKKIFFCFLFFWFVSRGLYRLKKKMLQSTIWLLFICRWGSVHGRLAGMKERVVLGDLETTLGLFVNYILSAFDSLSRGCVSPCVQSSSFPVDRADGIVELTDGGGKTR